MENVFSSEWDSTQDRPGFQWNRMRLARRLGGVHLGGSVYLLAPGQKSFPYHLHHANEEMLVVLEGTVVLRTPAGEVEMGVGDAKLFPIGPAGAHQVINRSDEPARFLMMSTMNEPEIAEYPDSGNIGVFSRAPGTSRDGELDAFLDGSAERDYFHGE